MTIRTSDFQACIRGRCDFRRSANLESDVLLFQPTKFYDLEFSAKALIDSHDGYVVYIDSLFGSRARGKSLSNHPESDFLALRPLRVDRVAARSLHSHSNPTNAHPRWNHHPSIRSGCGLQKVREGDDKGSNRFHVGRPLNREFDPVLSRS